MEKHSLSFDDANFAATAKELEEPHLDAYEFFVESHDIKIWRQYNQLSGLYTYKVYGAISESPPDIVARVYLDIEYRKKWDSYVNELKDIQDDSISGIYWCVNFPFPLAKRDYAYRRECRELDLLGKHYHVIFAQSHVFPSHPEVKGCVRVLDYMQRVAITSDGSGGTKAFMWYFDNPRGLIPTWLINWAAKTGVPKFILQMRDACRDYSKYLEDIKRH